MTEHPEPPQYDLDLDPYDEDVIMEAAALDAFALCEPDGFPMDYVEPDGSNVQPDEDCDEDCHANGFCVCSLW